MRCRRRSKTSSRGTCEVSTVTRRAYRAVPSAEMPIAYLTFDDGRADAAAAGLETVRWDVSPEDWSCPGVDAIVSRVLGSVEDGAIVLFHDGGGDRSQTVAAVDEVLSVLRPRGFEFRVLLAGD